MKRTLLAVFIGIFVSADASAVSLNPNGLGQVLIYPYYTVEAGQGTLLSVVNTKNVGKAVKVRFLEAYNGRDVLVFNLFLAPFDVWTVNIFALADAGLAGSGAAIFSADKSCTAPAFNTGPLVNGLGYQQFLNFGFTGANADGGPTSDSRTREGHVEMIAMADVDVYSPLYGDIVHVNGSPTGCASAEADFEEGSSTREPTSGLFGSASIVDVNEGTFYAYNADAVDGFTYVTLATPPGDSQPTLASANDRDNPLTATSRVFADGELLTSTFDDPIDAVSSLFVAGNIYNEYVTALDGSIGTDWVLTFPTKRFYVDPLLVTAAIPPFENRFGADESGNGGPGSSCISAGLSVFDREGQPEVPPCGFATCPPGRPPYNICLETNVLRFSQSSIVGTQLPTQSLGLVPSNGGIVELIAGESGHDMHPASNGNIFHGLPITGFAVTRFINNFVPGPGGAGYALANYTAAYRHRLTTSCTRSNGDPCS